LKGGIYIYIYMEKRHQLIGYSKIEDREHSLIKFNSYADFKENLIDREDLEGYTDYIVRDHLTKTSFIILEVPSDYESNIVNKLKKMVSGYFAYDKTR